jgi:threonyl-tRNA synthetase
VQLDRQMPARFGLSYMGPDNVEHPVFVIHRAIMGSFERFIGILVEHYAGAFPFWLAPVQIRVIPVAEPHREAAERLAAELAPYRVEVDASSDTLGKRIRNAEVEKIPFVIVYGDKESDEALAIREHGGGQSTASLVEFRANLATLSPWQAGAEPSLTS